MFYFEVIAFFVSHFTLNIMAIPAVSEIAIELITVDATLIFLVASVTVVCHSCTVL